jgi:hypothetical protein
MRKIEIRILEGIYLLYVDDEYTGIEYTKRDMNAMLDDLEATYALSDKAVIGRNGLMADLIARSLRRCYSNRPLEDGPLTPDELTEALRLIKKSIKRGWFA